MRSVFVFAVLVIIKLLSKVFYRFDCDWVGELPTRPWSGIRLAALLHHTSLYEPIFLGVVPNAVLWRIARHGLVPGADKTLNRPLVGLFYKLFARRVISITRRRDQSWSEFMDQIDPGRPGDYGPRGPHDAPLGSRSPRQPHDRARRHRGYSAGPRPWPHGPGL